jgi:hypothetical protein
MNYGLWIHLIFPYIYILLSKSSGRRRHSLVVCDNLAPKAILLDHNAGGPGSHSLVVCDVLAPDMVISRILEL